MRNRRIPAILFCIILLLGGCGSRRADANADGNGQSVSESADGQLVLVFNRLADTENVESVVVNETVYTAK